MGAQRQVMSLVGQYSPALFQEVFALLHEVVEGCVVEDWSTIAVRSARRCRLYQGGKRLSRGRCLSQADSEPTWRSILMRQGLCFGLQWHLEWQFHCEGGCSV